MARRTVRTTMKHGTLPNFKENNLTFLEAVDLFLADVYLKGQSPETSRWHKENLTALFKVLTKEGADTTPSSITERILKKNFILPQINKGLKPNTINGRVRSCRALFTYLHKEGYIKVNPTLRLDKLKKDKPIIETFTKSQIKKLLSVINKEIFVGFRDYVIILLILETGIRILDRLHLTGQVF